MESKKNLEDFWAVRKQGTIETSLEIIEFLETELNQALTDLGSWKTKLKNNPDIPTLQKAGIVFGDSIASVERSSLGGATLHFLKTLEQL